MLVNKADTKGQFRWFIKKVEEALEQADLRIVNVEGHPELAPV